ncbi:MAG: hypothetical protein QOI54_2960 [Actinomycetota bacterium]|nr:hypothetical protein [Actinomycetota bacterium]
MHQQPHYCRWMPRRPATTLALPLLLALVLGACGNGSATSTTSGADGSDTAPSSTAAPSGDGSGGAVLEVTRSGGIAGVRDVVRVAADGTAAVSSRDGRRRSCRPAAADLARLRQMDLSALDALPSSAPVPDGFVFRVRSSGGAAVVGEGESNGRRADLLDAAAAVVAACLAGQPAGGGGNL